MREILIAALVLLAASPSAMAQQVCVDFERAVDNSLKIIASESAEGVADDSAARETMREARIGNHLQLISINLGLMRDQKCPTRKTPIYMGEFLKNALECSIARMKGEKDSASCSFENWKREDSRPAPAKEN